MTNRKQTTAIALTGAIALASGAYALGTQVGGGTAGAAAGARGQQRPPLEMGLAIAGRDGQERRAHTLRLPGAPFEDLADRLGVDADKLRETLEDIRQDLPRPAEAREDFADELAKELGTTAGKVEAALERLRERHEQELEDRRAELAKRLADRLNLDADEVEEALGDGLIELRHRAHPPRP
jgi:hypothetical protein